jgi:excisionase family DNA binding protein
VTARDRLLASLSPELVAALEEFVEERVREGLANTVEGNGTASPWLSLDEAADYLRVSPRTLERRIKTGRVWSTMIGRRRLLRREDLDALAKAATGEETARTAPPHRRRGVE